MVALSRIDEEPDERGTGGNKPPPQITLQSCIRSGGVAPAPSVPIMGLFDFFKPKKPGSALDQFWDLMQEDPNFKKQKELFGAMSGLWCKDGCETDEIPGGYGEFGYERTNPIPTNTLFGSTSYLVRLRSLDGAKVVYKRRGSLGSPVSQHPIDRYEIVHPDGRLLATIYLSPYHKKNSDKAPRGFTLLESIFGSVADCFVNKTLLPQLLAADAARSGVGNEDE